MLTFARLLGLVLTLGLAIPPAFAAKVLDASGPPLSLELHQGRLVRLDRAAASVFVADPEVADVQVKSPQIIYVFGKKTGETSLFAVDGNDQMITGMPVVVQHNVGRLNAAIRNIVATGVKIDSVDGSLVMSGNVPTAVAAEELRRVASGFVSDEKLLVNRLKVTAPNQVNLRVRVAEVNREITKRFGVNWDALLSVGDFAFGVAQGLPTTGTAGFPNNATGTRSPIVRRGNAANNLIGAISTRNLDLNTVVDALENEGVLTILAEPNLTAMTGETASFLAGGEFPVPVPQSNDTVTITYKRFGVSLTFTPTILQDGRINLNVKPEVSQLTAAGSVTLNGFVIPALATRRAETTIELGSGQSFAVAGLLASNTNQDLSKFPGLGDVPVLGPLFRSDVFRRGETELVIIVTPYLVKPANAQQLMALPTDGFVPPNDGERIFGRQGWNQISGRSGQTGSVATPSARPEPAADNLVARRRTVGSAGFMLE